MRLFSGFRFYFESLLATKWCVELWSVATLAVIYAKVHTDALQPATIIMGKCQMQYIGSYILHMYKRGAGLPHSQFYVRMCIGSVAEQGGLFTIFVVSALVISKFILCATRKKFLLMHKLWGCFFHNEMSTENLLIGKKMSRTGQESTKFGSQQNQIERQEMGVRTYSVLKKLIS